MPTLARLPSSAYTAITVIFHSLALSTTTFRLAHRIRTRRFWWDDFWAVVAFACDTVVFLMFLIRLRINITGAGSEAGNWILLLAYKSILWSARLTVAVTIVRLLPKGTPRRVSTAMAILFGLFWMSIIVQIIVACSRKGGPGFPYCTIVPKYALYTGMQELATNLLADMWLILAPAYMLYRMKLQRAHYKLILTIFLCGIFSTLASVSHVVFIIMKAKDVTWQTLTGHIELAVAVIVSNLLVLVTYLYRVFRNISNPETPPRDRRLGAAALASQNPHAVENMNSSTGGAIGTSGTSTGGSLTSGTWTTTVELTEISHLGTTLDLSTNNNPSSHDSSGTQISAPYSSFSYPSTANS